MFEHEVFHQFDFNETLLLNFVTLVSMYQYKILFLSKSDTVKSRALLLARLESA